MDPNATYAELKAAMASEDHETAYELACALRDWLDKGGFPPKGQTRDSARNYAMSALLSLSKGTSPLGWESV